MYFLKVQNLWQNLLQLQQKFIFRKASFRQIKCKINKTDKKVSSKVPILSNHDLELSFTKSLETKHTSCQTDLLDT